MLPDVVVIGGGASGLIAAGRAAETGASVVLVEKMESLGRKLLLTGNGRCNLSNAMEMADFVGMYGENGRFLSRAFEVFFRDDMLHFLVSRGVATKTEPDGRIFPVSDNARDVLRALEGYTASGGVTVRTGSAVDDLLVDRGRVAGVKIGGQTLASKAVLVACGGSSYPGTGSDGAGCLIAAKVGHSIVRLRPALVSLVVVEDERARRMQGVSLHGVRLTSYRGAAGDIVSGIEPTREVGRGISGARARGPVVESRIGDLMFTHFGIGGPVTLRMSLAIVDALSDGPVSVSIDLVPEQSRDELSHRLQSDFDRSGKKSLRNILRGVVPGQVAEALILITGVTGDRMGNQIGSAERDQLVGVMKSMRFSIRSARPLAEAMVTAGGVSLDEIDPRTMGSRFVGGLYFCGEVIDIDAETGGYNLQAAFSTGYLAGQSAAASVLGRH
jgi:hypothetical protein